MVSIVTKKIKGNEYLYLVESIRKKDKIIQKSIKYLGKKRPIPSEELECMQFSYKKKDWILNDFKDTLSYQKHKEMRKASSQYNNYLSSLDKLSQAKEKEKFLSIFIANSNAIEGSTMTAKDTFEYLFNDTLPLNRSKKELFMAENLLLAWKYLEKNSNRFPIKDDLLVLHSLVNRGIETDNTLGKFKRVQNYIGDVLTSSHIFVEEKMDTLFSWIKEAYKKVYDFEVAFQSHAQFEIIHPFVDGNGRVGRLLLNWLLMYKNLMPLAINIKRRNDYIEALNNSRKGKIEAICKFCYNEYMKQYKFV